MMNIKRALIIISTALLAAACSSPRGGTASYPDNSAATTKGSNARIHMGGSPHVDATIPPAGAAVPLTDSQFVMQAAQMGMAEVRMGEMATRKARDSSLKRFGAHLVDDHARANTELSALAERKGFASPQEVGPTENAILQRLRDADATEFDAAFRQASLQTHERALRVFRTAAQNLSDPDLRAFAQKQLPVLEHHLSMAEGLTSGSAVGGTNPDKFFRE